MSPLHIGSSCLSPALDCPNSPECIAESSLMSGWSN
ncbi:hypothetical protein C349_06991 [Cryptococcus neoformans var. grubii Br795]|uniref:Uncharacterized protein n=1 Tax=Cryptococcus neoformans Tu259-1 TaxID=1230072 RepID=A0A854Q1Q9_CRYNE|nr:hypothetical protein C353_06907 [Cryptococcus neoformans var. grubii AD1-83a]OXG10330.1 hypothetical protein C361_07027 [Cryptococcus neoformans var. grubii Tu259-1]OXG41149.1 hypothetical protein C355_06904 [Cryptococcus neoformans var. grubii Th84]OXG42963.1 hypothetical protein C354_06886 [Cryptococcus neoformans var. grubii MW-RSA1955]OXG47225.1 hypothetical protein C352_06909 [Cryptococcus neoformans var. grubii CHC193]OXG56176.1 hypothetical protein C351_06888 [Cryptococcus neoformans